MGNIVGGHNLGLLDGSFTLLDRKDRTGNGTMGQGVESNVNVANGNLVIQERDALIPSRGADFELLRTYNSRAQLAASSNWGWSWSTGVALARHNDRLLGQSGNTDAYIATYGDGSNLHFDFDATKNLWVSTDGAGAYETLQVLSGSGAIAYVLTRADQTQFNFDKNFTLLSSVDTNGVRMDYEYQANRLVRVRDDTGHVLTFTYASNNLVSVVDESNLTLVQYAYTNGRLTSVTDRHGHVTSFAYNGTSQLLESMTLPDRQTVNGQVQQFDQRQIRFTYQTVDWRDTAHVNTDFDVSNAPVLTELLDAMGGRTTFDYGFTFGSSMVASDRDVKFQVGGNRFFTGGTTRVVDAMGNGLATSNASEFQQKRAALGFAADLGALTQAQKDTLRQMFSVTYRYDADGYITEVTDQQGFKTTYAYDAKDNLTSITDRNGFAATNSDAAYFRALRADLGLVDAGGNGKLVANLSAAEKTALLAKFTTSYAYDGNGNLLSRTDAAGNLTTYTYTAFNKIASETSGVGNALVSSDDPIYRQKRSELGFPPELNNLNDTHKAALKDLYTTTYTYDAKQNLTQRKNPGGDLTRFEYDAFGSLSKKTVFLDASDLVTPAKQQVTQFFYDPFGNNVETVDAEGVHTFRTFDHFGNMLTSVDGRGGVTTNTYDADNRLLTTTDPEGHTVVNAFDAVGNKISIRDANGHTITQVFDKNNLLIATIDPSATAAFSRTTTFKYDILGNRTEVTDAEGRKTTYTFDPRRQLVDVSTPQVLNGSEQLVTYHTTYAYDGEGNVVTHTDNNGNVTQSLYTPHGLLKRETNAVGNITEYLYDANLQRLQITVGMQLAAALRKTLRFGYDEENQLIKETDALGGSVQYAYDAPGNVVAITDENGHATDYQFDRNNRLLKETRPQVTDPVTGQPVRYTVLHQYDANGNEIALTNENGQTTMYAFDKDDKVVLVTDANGIKTVFRYDSRHNVTQIAVGAQASLDANGRVVLGDISQAQITSYAYDEFNQLVAETDGVGNALIASDQSIYQKLRAELGFAPLVANLSPDDKTNLVNRFTSRSTYDRVGNLTRNTDHLGRVTSYEYDALNRTQKRTESTGLPDQRATSLRYDGNGNLVRSVDPLGRVTTKTFDGLNRLVEESDALGSVTRYEYDAFDNRVGVTLAAGTPQARTSRYVYDLNDRVTQEIDPEGHTQRYEYDAVGNRLKVTDGRGGATQFVYDALDRNIRIIDPLGFATRYEYDGAGNRITVVDAKGGITRLQYDPGNRYIQTTDNEGRVTRLAYDVLGNTITETTAFGTPQAQITNFVYDAEGNLREVSDAEGKASSIGYDAAYNEIRTTDGNGHTTTYVFDAFDRQIKVTDPFGGETKYTYDAADNRLTEIDPLGRTRAFQYDANDRVIVETDALGVETRYAYDLVDNQISITRAANTPQASVRSFVYNKDDLLVRQTDALGNVSTLEYDGNHNVTKVTDGNGHATVYAYDAADQLISITDPIGSVTSYKYDSNGNRVQVIDGRGNANTTFFNKNNEAILSVDAEGAATSSRYDPNGNVVAQTLFMTPLSGPIDPSVLPAPTASAADQTTLFEYDKLNRLIRQTNALGGVKAFTYDAVSNRLTETDENGHVTTFAYDNNDRLIRQTNPLGGVRTLVLDAVGNRLSETDENGHRTSFAYDAENRVTQQTDALGGMRKFTYDAVGNQLTETDENGHTTTFGYDPNDRLVRQADALGGVRAFEYDAVGNQTALSDENGNTTTFAYDASDRLVTRTDPLGGVRSFAYDAADNQVGATDENRHTVTSQYDRNNRLISVTDARNGVRRFTYDAAGNRLSVTDENGHATSAGFDALNRLIRETDPLGGVTRFTFDAVGNILTRTDKNNQTTTFVFDANDRVITETDPLGGIKRYTYDAVGNELTSTDQNGNATTSVYDANDRVLTTTNPLGGVVRLSYDGVGNQLSQTDENGHTTTHAYDANDRRISTADPLGGIARFSYDAGGNTLSVTDQNGHVTAFTYDDNNRQLTETDPLGKTESSSYDAAGNRVSLTDRNGHTTAFAYDENNRLIRKTNPLGGVRTYAYDAVGNSTTETDEKQHATRYEYDGNNRLTAQIDPEGGVRRYTYDAMGHRITETDENGHGNRFEYDENGRVVRQIDRLGGVQEFTYDAVGNLKTSIDENDHTTTYAYDANDRLVSQTNALGGVKTYTYDAAGNDLTETEENGHFAVSSDTALYRGIRVRLGVVDAAGQGKLVANLTAAERQRILESFTTSYAYDANDRLIKQTDAQGGQQTFTYDAGGNRLGETNENGNFAVSSDAALYREIRARLGVVDTAGQGKLVANLTEDEKQTILDGFTTHFEYDDNDRLVKQTDALGGQQTFTYDAVGNRLGETDENGNFAVSSDTTFYRQIRARLGVVDAAGGGKLVADLSAAEKERILASFTTSFEYDANDRLLEQTDPLGKVQKFEYDLAGNVTRETDENGNARQYKYDDNDRRIEEIDPLGESRLFAFDAAGNNVQVTDPLGNKTTFYYDANDQLVLSVDPEGAAVSTVFDPAGNILSQTLHARRISGTLDPAVRPQVVASSRDQTTQYVYDELDREIKRTDPEGGVATSEYDAVGNRISETDENDNGTTYTYDGGNRQLTRANAAGDVLTYVYDAVGNLISETDERGATTTSVYDANDRLLVETNASGGQLKFTYDAVGNTLTSTDEEDRVTTFTYDGNNRVLTEANALGGVKRFAYDAVGNKVGETDENGNTTLFAYDAGSFLTREQDAAGNSRRITYDDDHNILRIEDSRLGVTKRIYDKNGRVTEETDAAGKIARHTYDAAGNRIALTDGRNNRSFFYHNRNNELILSIDPEGFATSHTYDAFGNLLSTTVHMTKLTGPFDPAVPPTVPTSPADRITTAVYDELNRRSSQTDPEGFTTTYVYDEVGNLIQTTQQVTVNTPVSEVRASNIVAAAAAGEAVVHDYFDDLGRRVATLSAEGLLTTFAYDASGREITRIEYDHAYTAPSDGSAPAPDEDDAGRKAEHTYDAAGRLETEKNPLDFVTRYVYDAAGNVVEKIEAEGTDEQRSTKTRYDVNGRIEEEEDAAGVVTHYVRDANGNVIERHDAFGTENVRVTLYTYDANNRVASETAAMGNALATSDDPIYRQKRTELGFPAELAQLTDTQKTALKARYTTTYTYDENGNMRTRTLGGRTESFEYDANDRLSAQVNGAGERTEFEYDGAGNRIRVTVAPDTTEERTLRYEYDVNDRLIAEVDGNGVRTVHRYDGAGNKIETTQADGITDEERHTIFTYDVDNRLISVTDPGGGVTTYGYDSIGNQIQITDAKGSVTNNTYDALGRLLTSTVVGGTKIVNSYDAFDNVISTTESLADGSDARVTSYQYDELNRQTTVTDAEGFSTVFEYDEFGNKTSLTRGAYLVPETDEAFDSDKAERAHTLVQTFTYDAMDLNVSTSDALGNTLAYTYDVRGNRLTQTTGAGTADARTVTYAYDLADRVIRQQNQEGGLVRVTYDEAGNQVKTETLQRGVENGTGATAPVWVVEELQYDGNGRVNTEIDSFGTRTVHEFDALGNEIAIVSASGNTAEERRVEIVYDLNSRVIADIDALDKRIDYVLDGAGNRIKETDSQGRVTHYYYDANNRHIGTLDPEGFYTRFTRDASGNTIKTEIFMGRYTAPEDDMVAPTPAAGDEVRVLLTDFDKVGNLVGKTAPGGARTVYVRDSVGNMIRQEDQGNGNANDLARTTNTAARVVTLEYDDAGRLTRFVNVDKTVETYTYDSGNNRISETVTPVAGLLANGKADPVRSTTFTFDKNNRLTRQVLDSTGLNLVQTLEYDKAGNVIAKTEGGNRTISAFDRNNRLVSTTDSLGRTVSFGYDVVGNQTSITDGRGNRIDVKFDKNNRPIEEQQPSTTIFTIAGGEKTVRPTTTTVYDSHGNVVQTIDPNGNKTTRYYDGNDNLVAEINGDNVLREFTVDATGAQTSSTLYMTRLSAAAHDPAAKPGAPAGEKRTITSVYDGAGRLVKTTYPQIQVTTLTGTNTGDPTASTTSVTPVEENFYDAFGNRVESIDRNGNHSFAYFDVLGRTVATVDAAGYLIESAYDAQGNVVQQRKHAQALTGVSAGERPTPSAAAIAVVDRVYDAANRQIEELSPAVQLDGGTTERVLTKFVYDTAGNQTQKITAAGTSEESVEYSYYDGLNQRIALVNAGRTLHLFGFDANGNQTSIKRFINTVPTATNLKTATLAQVIAAVTADPTRDQTTTLTYDALNRQLSTTDEMGAGTTDDIKVSTSYDAVGNVTRRTDATNSVTRSEFDAVGHATRTISPDGNISFVRYDAAGLRVMAWTGDLGAVQAQPATNVTAKLGKDLLISWKIPVDGQRSYVVYDTDQGSAPADYSKRSAESSTSTASAAIALDAFAAGTVLYFRVVTVDAAGSTAWTEERSLTVPARPTELSVTQSLNNLLVRVRFSGTVTSPVLRFGAVGSALSSTVNFVVQSDGSYLATVTNPANGGQGQAYQITWTFGGANFVSSALPFEAIGAHVAVNGILSWPLSLGASGGAAANGQFVIVDGVRVGVADVTQVNGTLQFNPGTLAAGQHVYHVYYGDLVATSHSVTITNEDHQTTSVLSDTNTFDNSNPPVQTKRTQVLRWAHGYHTHVAASLNSAESATIGSGGLHVAFKTADSGDVFSGGDVAMASGGGGNFAATLNLNPGTYDLLVYYFDTSGKRVIVEWRRTTVPAATLPGDVTVEDTVSPFDFGGQSVTSGGVTDSSFPFTDGLVRTVAGNSVTATGQSVIVSAFERQGAINRAANGTITVDPGLYAGALDPNLAAVAVSTPTTSSAGAGTLKSDGLSAGTYFTEIEYDALGTKIATNEDSSLWRRFGVDAMGNTLQTRTFGTRAAEQQNLASIVTFAAYDARNQKIADFGAAAPVAGSSTPQRAVTRITFDYAGQMLTRLDPHPTAQAQQFTYDAAGNLIRQTDGLGFATTIAYDRRGNEVRRTDPLNHSRRKVYNAAGQLTQEIDAKNVAKLFAYDAFDRPIETTDALGNKTTFAYDQHDRLTQTKDGNNNTTKYTYDKRDNLLWVEDANHHFFGQAFDVMGRVTHLYSFQGSNPTSLDNAIDALTNTTNAAHAGLVDQATSYDILGNKLSETDGEKNADGTKRTRTFTYGGFGRLLNQTDEGGRQTTFEYDRFGRTTVEARAADTTTRGAKRIVRAYDAADRLTSVTDQSTDTVTSGASSVYTYDVAGNRKTEVVTAHTLDASGNVSASASTVRNITYTYDGIGQMLSWSDSVTGKSLSYQFDKAGNRTKVTGSDNLLHTYAFDENDRVTEVNYGTSVHRYTYDAAGNRKTFANTTGGSTLTATYTYDKANRLEKVANSDGTSATWSLDAVGNILTYKEFKADNSAQFTQTSTYAPNNRTLTSSTNNSRDASDISITATTNQLDLSGRLLSETIVDTSDSSNVTTTVFTHTYTPDGRETAVTASGANVGSGSTSATYDSNDKLFSLNLGQSDTQERAEVKFFISGTDGQILTRFHDDGENDTANNTLTHYLYANGDPVGETGNDTTVAPGNNNKTVLDVGDYSLVKNVSDEFPAPSVGTYEVQLGDNLQSIAAKVYGNPSLWFVIAEANGLTGSEELKPGTRLTIPNTIDSGRLTNDTHLLYNESDIVGSKLPNIKAPPPSSADKCKLAAAIILIILVAIIAAVVTVATAGAAAPLAAGLLGVTATSVAGIIVGVVVGAAIGAAFGFVAGVITQGILIGFGLQKEFDWTQVAADTVAGAFEGIAAAVVKLVKIGLLAGRLAKVVRIAADATLSAVGETSRQLIATGGRIEQPWAIAVAGVGAFFGALGQKAVRLGRRVVQNAKVGRFIAQGLLKDAPAGTIVRNAGGTKVIKAFKDSGEAVIEQVDRVSFKGPKTILKKADIKLVKIGDDIKEVRRISSQFSLGQRIQRRLGQTFNVGEFATKTIGKGQITKTIQTRGLVETAQGIFEEGPQTIQAFRKTIESGGSVKLSDTIKLQKVGDKVVPVRRASDQFTRLERVRRALVGQAPKTIAKQESSLFKTVTAPKLVRGAEGVFQEELVTETVKRTRLLKGKSVKISKELKVVKVDDELRTVRRISDQYTVGQRVQRSLGKTFGYRDFAKLTDAERAEELKGFKNFFVARPARKIGKKLGFDKFAERTISTADEKKNSAFKLIEVFELKKGADGIYQEVKEVRKVEREALSKQTIIDEKLFKRGQIKLDLKDPNAPKASFADKVKGKFSKADKAAKADELQVSLKKITDEDTIVDGEFASKIIAVKKTEEAGALDKLKKLFEDDAAKILDKEAIAQESGKAGPKTLDLKTESYELDAATGMFEKKEVVKTLLVQRSDKKLKDLAKGMDKLEEKTGLISDRATSANRAKYLAKIYAKVPILLLLDLRKGVTTVTRPTRFIGFVGEFATKIVGKKVLGVTQQRDSENHPPGPKAAQKFYTKTLTKNTLGVARQEQAIAQANLTGAQAPPRKSVEELAVNPSLKVFSNGHTSRARYMMGYRDGIEVYDTNYRRQHNWTPLDWANAASAELSRIYSPLGLDHAIDYDTALNTNRMNAGQVADFEREDVVKFAGASAGRVTSNAIPIELLNALAPEPEPLGLPLPTVPIPNLPPA